MKTKAKSLTLSDVVFATYACALFFLFATAHRVNHFKPILHTIQAKSSLLTLLIISTFVSGIFLHRPVPLTARIGTISVIPYPKPHAMTYMHAWTHFVLYKNIYLQSQLVTKLKISCASQSAPS